MPEEKWLKNSMERNTLFMRKAEMISGIQKANTWKSFIFFGFYDHLKKIYYEHPDLDESKIFNYDETGFPTDQNGGKFISVKVECAFKPLLVQEGNILCSGCM